jgi:hypothetical protein
MYQLQGKDFIIVQIGKKEVEQDDYNQVEALLTKLEKDTNHYFQTAHFIFDGYEHDAREIFEIPAICEWVTGLLKQYQKYSITLSSKKQAFKTSFCV